MSRRAFDDFDTRPTPAGKAAQELDSLELSASVQVFIEEILPKLDDGQLWQLRCALPASEGEIGDDEEYGADFSLASEIGSQLKAVRAMRLYYFPSGKPRANTPVKELQGVLTLTNNMIKTLMKSHEDIMNMERSRLVEAAIVEVLTDMSDKHAIEALGFDPRENFLAKLEEKLEAIN